MLDFDYVCQRKEHSVKAMVYPFRYNFVLNLVTETYCMCSFKKGGKSSIRKLFKVNNETTKVTLMVLFKICRFLFKVKKKKTWTTSMNVLLVPSLPVFNMYMLTGIVYFFYNGYFLFFFLVFLFRYASKNRQPFSDIFKCPIFYNLSPSKFKSVDTNFS